MRKAKDGTLKGLSGRALKIGATWKCPKNEWHVGIKAAYDFFPRGLISRLTKKRKKDWDEKQRTLSATLVSDLHALRDAKDEDAIDRRKDLELRLAQLKTLQGSWKDPGPLYDCVVFPRRERLARRDRQRRGRRSLR